jgi:hypothetical protein
MTVWRCVAAAALALLVCPFAVPAGANHVQAANGKSVSFDHKTGNEWWVEVLLGGPDAASVSKVEGMDTGGPWTALPKQSWGAYAASFHIEPGHQVRFRATWANGAAVESCWFTHPAGVEQACGSPPPPPPPPPPSGFSVSFTGVKGNEWWVEAKASGSKPIAQVDARADGGAWQTMTLRSWGAWAASFHVNPGGHVQLRARATDGSYSFPPNGWVWPAASSWPPPSSTFDARFENVKGNPNWVQVNVYAAPSWGLGGVSFRVDGGAWKPMTRQAYGDWTANPAVPDGSLVQFRAESGQTATSGTYRWPSATPVGPWPVAGSYATYTVSGHDGSPMGDVYGEYDGTVAFRYTSAGTWQATCDITRHGHTDYDVPHDTYATRREVKTLAPPMLPTDAVPGQRVEDDSVGDCAYQSLTVDVVGPGSVATRQSGTPATAPTWHGYLDDCGCHAWQADWARHQGLLLEGSFAGMGSGHSAKLLDTDAPIR